MEGIVVELLYTKAFLYFLSTLKDMRGTGLLAFLPIILKGRKYEIS